MIARVVLIGNLTRDPEGIADGRGCTFGLAVNQRVKRGEEWQDHASFFEVVVWGKQAENCMSYLNKGSRAAVDGALRQERWEKDGQKRSAVKVIAQTVQFLGDAGGGGNGGNGGQRFTPQNGEIPFDQPAAPAAGSQFGDDIPFG